MALNAKATTGLSSNKTNCANPIDKTPYYGVRMTSHLMFTYGGLRADLGFQVLSTHNVSIPGLHTTRELTGLFYNEYPPTTSCLGSMSFGRDAGLALAKKLEFWNFGTRPYPKI